MQTLALVHALGSGTDASLQPVRYALLASVVPVAALFVVRLRRERAKGARRRVQVAPVVGALEPGGSRTG